MALNDRQLTTAPPQDAVLIAPMNVLDGGDDFFQSFRGRSGLKHFMRMRQVEAEAPNLPYRQLFSNTDFN